MISNKSLVQQSEALAAERGVQPLRLTVTGKKKITLYAAPKPEERDDRVFPHMWVHCLRIRPSKRGLFVLKQTWDALPELSASETIVHEWPAVTHWIGLKPPVSFEKKQSLLRVSSIRQRQVMYDDQQLHDWMAEVWSEDMVKREFEMWKSIRDAEHHDMVLLKREPKWVVNPRLMRWMGYVFAFHADKGKARVAQIVLELDIATAVYNYAPSDFKEQMVEEFAGPYEPEEQDERKDELRRSNLGFHMALVGEDVKWVSKTTYLHVRQEEFRSALQNLVEYFRRSRVENRQADDLETEVAVYIWPAVLEIFLGGTFVFEPGKIISNRA